MLYRNVPKTGDKLSILGYGCMRFPLTKTGTVNEDKAILQIRHAIDNGVNYFDTAPIYHFGRSEPTLARALEDGYRDKVRIATKLPPWSVRTRHDMDQILAAQLSTLHTDYIDYYLLHNISLAGWNKLKSLGLFEFLDTAKKDGRIRNTGFSFHSDFQAFREIIDGYNWEFCQIQYNYLDENNQAGTKGLQYAASKRLAVVIMEPLRGGNLAAPVPDKIKTIWEETLVKRTPAEWGLRWVWNHPEVTVVLSGMNTISHIDENLRIAASATPNSLTSEELALVARVRDTYRELMKISCTGCSYCMPCPSGVNIPECFSLFNSHRLFPQNRELKMLYLLRLSGVIGERSYAGLCQKCGKCVRICPQHLPIPDHLRDVSAVMEGKGMPVKVTMLKGVLWCYNQAGRISRLLGRKHKRRGY